VKFADAARRHELSRGLLWQWRDVQRRGTLASDEPVFVPLRVVPQLPLPERRQATAGALSAPASDPSAEPDDRIEIVLPDVPAVRVAEGLSMTALRRVLTARRG
jgi:transposase